MGERDAWITSSETGEIPGTGAPSRSRILDGPALPVPRVSRTIPEWGANGHGSFAPAAINHGSIAVASIEAIARGTVRLIRWEGMHGEFTHMFGGYPFRSVCGALPIHRADNTDPEDATSGRLITCPECCRLLIKKNWRGPSLQPHEWRTGA